MTIPPKFNIAPQKWWFEDHLPIGTVTFNAPRQASHAFPASSDDGTQGESITETYWRRYTQSPLPLTTFLQGGNDGVQNDHIRTWESKQQDDWKSIQVKHTGASRTKDGRSPNSRGKKHGCPKIPWR